jgi:hypothetical protein
LNIIAIRLQESRRLVEREKKNMSVTVIQEVNPVSDMVLRLYPNKDVPFLSIKILRRTSAAEY